MQRLQQSTRRLCVYWLQGACRHGDRCSFSHAPPEPLPFHQRQWRRAKPEQGLPAAARRLAGVRVMTYNILADAYAREHARDLYGSTAAGCLEWAARAALIAREVAEYAPDVVCLQEVDHYDDVAAALAGAGYAGAFLRRTGGRPDGLATFWRADRLRPVETAAVEYASLGLKDNVAQLLRLRFVGGDGAGGAGGGAGGSGAAAAAPRPPLDLVVTNIHVLFNPKRGDIKLAQVCELMKEARRLAHAEGEGEGARPAAPVVVCGDFNSAAGSPLHEFLVRGELDLSRHERRTVSGQVEAAGALAGRGWPAMRGAFVEGLALQRRGRGPAARGSASSPALAGGGGSGGGGGGGGDPGAPSSGLAHAASTPSGLGASGGRAPRAPRAWSREELASISGLVDDGGAESLVVRHPLAVRSAYASVARDEPAYSTAHDRYIGTVDYLFYTPEAPAPGGGGGGGGGGGEGREGGGGRGRRRGGRRGRGLLLQPEAVLHPPPIESLHSALPSVCWPSDHISLVADFGVYQA